MSHEISWVCHLWDHCFTMHRFKFSGLVLHFWFLLGRNLTSAAHKSVRKNMLRSRSMLNLIARTVFVILTLTYCSNSDARTPTHRSPPLIRFQTVHLFCLVWKLYEKMVLLLQMVHIKLITQVLNPMVVVTVLLLLRRCRSPPFVGAPKTKS